jgi:hypothetical protein
MNPMTGPRPFSNSGPERGRSADMATPSPARVYSYLQGGPDHFPVDREFGDRLVKAAPDIVRAVKANRSFLRRSVRWLAQQGIRQFIEIGAGLPVRENMHDIVQRVAPCCRVAYVDNDPIVLTHGRAYLDGDSTTVIAADLRAPGAILRAPDLRSRIDLDRPVAVCMFAVLHFVADEDDPYGIVDVFRKAIAPGSYLAVSHVSPGPGVGEIADMYTKEATEPGVQRTPDQIARFFKGLEMVPPGVVPVNQWRGHGRDVWVHGGLGQKP